MRLYYNKAMEKTDNELLMYTCFLNIESLSIYEKQILYYIGGYIVRSIVRKCSCTDCFKMLVDESFLHDKLQLMNPNSFVNFISRGKLKLCSETVFKIICAAEKAFKLLVIEKKKKLM